MMQVTERFRDCVLEEEAGEIRQCTRVFTISGVEADNIGSAFYVALNAAGVPLVREALADDFPHVRVLKRAPRLEDRSPDGTYIVRVTVTYQLQRPDMVEVVVPFPIAGQQIAIAGGCNLNQVTTRFENDRETRIFVEYDDGEGDAGEQNCEITVPEARQWCTRIAVMAAEDPDAVVRQWVNKINSAEWKGDEPQTWLCTNVQYRTVDATVYPNLYEFTFQFEHNPKTEDGHGGFLYAAVYKDANGEIPDWVEYDSGGGVENGLKDIEWHEEVDFNDLFRF